MDEISTIARDNAIEMELKKDALNQRQDGSWVMRVRVHPDDMDESIMKASMGTRYRAFFVEIDQNELPVERNRKTWNETTAAAQSGIRCGEKMFWEFLNVTSKEEAEIEVRKRCEVKSRTEFSTDERAAAAWETLDGDYQMYLRGGR